MTNEIRYQMIQNNTKINTLAEEDELKHYGVLGMKWGVRRYQKYGEGGYTPKGKAIAQKTYNKSIKKLDKLDSKAESAKLKSAALKARGTDLAYKGQKQQTFSLTEIGYATGKKNSMKGSKLIAKSAKKDREAVKAEQKADKWSKKMLENLKDVPAELTDAQKRTLEKHNLSDLIKENPKNSDAAKDKTESPVEEGTGIKIEKIDGKRVAAPDDIDAKTLESTTKLLKGNMKSIEKSVIDHIAETEYESLKDMRPDVKMTKDEFKKSVKLQGVYIDEDGTVELSVYSDGEHPLFGWHSLDVEYNPKTKKMGYATMNG